MNPCNTPEKDPPDATGQPEEPPVAYDLEVVEFRLGKETFAFSIPFVREVLNLEHFTRVPSAPRWLLGLMNLRGSILAVVDLRNLFNLPGKGLLDLTHVLVANAGALGIGILADEIVGTREYASSTLVPPESPIGELRPECIAGVAPSGTIVLDARRVFSDPALTVRHTPATHTRAK